MAISVENIPSDLTFSSQLEDFRFRSEAPALTVIMTTATAGLIYSSTLWLFAGVATVYDTRGLIAELLRLHKISYAEIFITVQEKYSVPVPADRIDKKTLTLKTLYCERVITGISAQEFSDKNFLTSLDSRRIAPGMWLSVPVLVLEQRSLPFTLTYLYRSAGDITPKTAVVSMAVQIKPAAYYGVTYFDKTYSSMLSDIKSADSSAKDISIISVAVQSGDRHAIFYVDREIELSKAFAFRNQFGCLEYVNLPTVTTAKTDTQYSVAIFPSEETHYDRRHTKTFSEECGPLSAAEAAWIDQMITSPEILRLSGKTDRDGKMDGAGILITDSSCEISDSHQKMNSIKFTWKFRDKYIRVSTEESLGIFTAPYNHTFS